jgi:hypothetical protein
MRQNKKTLTVKPSSKGIKKEESKLKKKGALHQLDDFKVIKPN